MEPIVVEVCGADYDACEKYSAECMSSKKKGSKFNRGCANTEKDPHRAERIGKLGEVAVGKLLGKEPDFTYRENGDQYDFVVSGGRQSVDVKTAMSRSSDEILIRVETDTGRHVPLSCDVYVGCKLVKENREERQATIAVYGFIKRTELFGYKHVPAKIGSHKNIEVPFSELHLPMPAKKMP